MMSTKFNLGKMTEPEAREILAWRYESPYDCYNPDDREVEKDLVTFMEPTNLYLAVRDGDQVLVGYLCYGQQAKVEGANYDEDALDIRGGGRPDLLGSGFGMMFVRVATDFGHLFFSPAKFRVTLAAFNTRAIRTCEKAGFARSQTFTGPDDTEYVVLTKVSEGMSQE